MEFIPLTLILSILLFISGLIDQLFSSAQQLLGPPSAAIHTAAVLGSAAFGVVVSIIGGTIAHSHLFGANSPFQTLLSRIRRPSEKMESRYQRLAYNQLVADTYDDSHLEDACAAISNMQDPLRARPFPYWGYK
jgi:hypothetical protein